jgi:hypothetical protein
MNVPGKKALMNMKSFSLISVIVIGLLENCLQRFMHLQAISCACQLNMINLTGFLKFHPAI